MFRLSDMTEEIVGRFSILAKTTTTPKSPSSKCFSTSDLELGGRWVVHLLSQAPPLLPKHDSGLSSPFGLTSS